MTTTSETSHEGAAGVHWDLQPLAGSPDDARAALGRARELSEAFAERYRGTVAEMDGAGLAAALEDLGEIENVASRAASYAHMRRDTDVTSEENRDLYAAVEQAVVEIMNLVRFFELEWLALPEERATELADASEVARDRHHLLSLRRYVPHTLSEPEERVLAERDPAAKGAWQNLFQQQISTIEVPFDGGEGEQPHTVDQLLAYVHHPDRPTRQAALQTLFDALEPRASVGAHVYDSLVADRLVIDRVRSYGGDPMAQTHLANELDPAVVMSMIDAVERNYEMARAWFHTKAGLLGVDRLELADQYAPVGDARTVGFEEARELLANAFGAFSPQVHDISDGFFADRRIDAEPRVGKRGGAYCTPVAQDAQPYVLMNFTDRVNDVMTLAHELGHGLHFTLAQAAQTPHSCHTGLALAEVPSTFSEFVVFDNVVAHEPDATTRRVLLAQRAEGSFATVFRQTVLCRYEQRAYAMRAEGSALTADRLSTIWDEENAKYYGDSLWMPDGYRLGWSYIPHFIGTRFYTYAYVFAKLVALALYRRWREEGAGFVDGYLGLLAAGSSDSPANLLRKVGVDLDDPGVWDGAFAELQRMVDAALEEASS